MGSKYEPKKNEMRPNETTKYGSNKDQMRAGLGSNQNQIRIKYEPKYQTRSILGTKMEPNKDKMGTRWDKTK